MPFTRHRMVSPAALLARYRCEAGVGVGVTQLQCQHQRLDASGVHRTAQLDLSLLLVGPLAGRVLRIKETLQNSIDPFINSDFIAKRAEKMRARIRAKVQHPFRVLKRQFGFTKVRYRGRFKNTGQIVTMFALANLWTARKQLLDVRR